MSDWRVWFRGLVASVVGGVAGSAGVVLADYQRIAGPGGLQVLWKVALISALTHLVFYLQKSPIPGITSTATGTFTAPTSTTPATTTVTLETK